MAPGTRRARLSRRDRGLLLLGAARADPRSEPAPAKAGVDVRFTSRSIEVFHHATRVAAHHRRYGGARPGTDPDPMPSAHRRYAAWSPERFQRWARSIGPNTEGLVVAVLANRPHPEQAFRTLLRVLRLFRGLAPARAEAVAARALAIGALTSKTGASTIQNQT